jgi:hypothetical protein
LPFPQTYRQEFIVEYIQKSRKTLANLLPESRIPDPAYFAGATFYLKKYKNRKVFGAEHGGLLNFTLSTYNNDKLPKGVKSGLIASCNKEREKQVLINLADEIDEVPYLEPSMKFLVYGSLHSFRDDVEQWNKDNPDRKYNLLEFTPDSLGD